MLANEDRYVYVWWLREAVRASDIAIANLASDIETLVCWERIVVSPAWTPRIDPEHGSGVDELWLNVNLECLRQPIRDVLQGVAADIVNGADDSAFRTIWERALRSSDAQLALRCLDRGAAALPILISSDPQQSTALLTAAANGHTAVIERLVAAGHDLHETGAGEFTPIHLAAVHGQTAAIEQLIRLGANPVARSRSGWTPLDFARRLCADAKLPDVEKVLFPYESPAAAAAETYRRSRRKP